VVRLGRSRGLARRPVRSVAAVPRFGQRVGSEHGGALRRDGRFDRSCRVGIIDIAVVHDLIGAVAEEPEVFEALCAGHDTKPTL